MTAVFGLQIHDRTRQSHEPGARTAGPVISAAMTIADISRPTGGKRPIWQSVGALEDRHLSAPESGHFPEEVPIGHILALPHCTVPICF